MKRKNNGVMLMKSKIFNGLTAVVTAFSILSCPVSAEFYMVPAEEYEKTEQNFTTIDISSVCNSWMSDDKANDEDYGWTNQGSGNDMSGFDLVGKHNLIGIDFDFVDKDKNDGKNCIVLRGQNNQGYPTQVTIPVNSTAAGVYFLHCAAWCTVNKANGWYTFEYEDGTESSVELIGGRDVADWWGKPETEYLRAAWTGPNGSTTEVSWSAFACENPQPGKKIKSITARTSGSDAYLMIAALTLTDTGPVFPEIEKNDADRSPDTTGWYRYRGQRAELVAGTPLDCSKFIESPAGKHGRVIVDNTGNFAFEDGTAVRFWGTNVCADAAFPFTNYDSEMLAQKIAQSGFNLVRFHIIDHYQNNVGGIFGIARTNGRGYNTVQSIQKLDPKMMDAFCYFLYQLKQRGIYYLIDTSSTAQKAFENDNIMDYRSVEQAGWRNGPGMFDEHLIELQIKQTSMILNWYNPYTECKIGDDDALAMLLLHNEFHFLGSSYLTGSEYYRSELRELLNNWLRERYTSTADLRSAWAQEGRKDLTDGESLEDGTVSVYSMREFSNDGNFSDKRISDTLQCYSEIVSKYYQRRIKAIRDEGFQVVISGTTDWQGALGGMLHTQGYCLANNTQFIDRHSYHNGNYDGSFAGPNIKIKAEQWRRPMLTQKGVGFLSQSLNAQTYGLPLTVSEWNETFTPVTHEGLAIMSAFSSMYNVNPFLFAFGGGYSTSWDGAFERNRYTNPTKAVSQIFQAAENPIMSTSFAAAAMMSLRNDVAQSDDGFYRRVTDNDANNPYYELEENLSWWKDKPGDKDYPLYYGEMMLVGRNGRMYDSVNYDPSKNNDDVLYKYKKTIEQGTPFISPNGQISSDRKNAIMKINTERTQVATGYISGRDIELDDVIINIDNEHGTVYASSTSYEPIWNADEVLITAEGQCWPEHYITVGDQLKLKDGVMLSDNTLVEQITGTITLKTREDVKVYMLTESGQEKGSVEVTRTPEGYASFKMSLEDQTPLYLIKKTGSGFKRTPNEHIVYEQIEREEMFDDMNGFTTEDTRKIERMVLQDYIYRSGKRTFSPEAPITRGDFSRLLTVSMLQKTEFEENYEDLEKTDLSYAYAGSMKARKIATAEDSESNRFRPGENLVFRDYAIYLAKSQTLHHVYDTTPKIEDRPKTTYKDIDLSDVEGVDLNDSEYCEALQKLIYWGYMEKSDIIGADDTVTRADAAIMLYDMLWE